MFSAIRRMLEEIYSTYLPKKAHPWCYISLDINPQNIDVNVHPTKHEVRFLHEDAIVERMKFALDERLAGNSASRTFYLQSRLPKADITKEVLEEVLPEYNNGNLNKSKKIHARELIRTDSCDQKLDKFNFTIHSAVKRNENGSNLLVEKSTHDTQPESLNSEIPLEKGTLNVNIENPPDVNEHQEKESSSNLSSAEHNFISPRAEETPIEDNSTPWSDILKVITADSSNLQKTDSDTSVQKDKSESIEATKYDVSEFLHDLDKTMDSSTVEKSVDVIADRARKQVYQYFGTQNIIDEKQGSSKEENEQAILQDKKEEENSVSNAEQSELSTEENVPIIESPKSSRQFKSYSVNSFKHEVKLTSILKLRKEVEDECHEGLRNILANLTFVGCVDQTSSLVQSGVNLYICNTKKLT